MELKPYICRDKFKSITDSKPSYWNWLPLDTREYVVEATWDYVLKLIERPAWQGEGYAYFENWKGHTYAIDKCFSMGRKMFKAIHTEERRLRRQAINAGTAIRCGAKRQNGNACKLYTVKGKNRCKYHGGMNTGPISIEGQLKRLASLRQYKNNPELLAAKRQEIRSNYDNGKNPKAA